MDSSESDKESPDICWYLKWNVLKSDDEFTSLAHTHKRAFYIHLVVSTVRFHPFSTKEQAK